MLVVVELANPDAVQGAPSANLAHNGVMIRADQPHEAALAEVRAHYGLKDDLYTCSFAQQRPGRPRPIFIAPSAWSLVDPSTDLQLFVVPLDVKPENEVKQSPAEGVIGESTQGDLVQPTASQATSNGVAPATPSNTDDSEDSDEVSDSDAEVAPAPAQALDSSARPQHLATLPEDASPAAGPIAGPSGVARSTPGTAHGSDRDRSPTPSPSNRSAKAKLRHLIEQAERAAASSPSPVPSSARPRSRSSTPPSQPIDRSTLEHSIESHASFRIGLDDGGNVAFVPPSPLPRCEPGPSSRSKGKERARSPSERSDAVSPAVEVYKTLKRSPSSLDNTPRKRLHRASSPATTATSPRVPSPYVAAATAAAASTAAPAPSPGTFTTDSSSSRNSGPSGRAAPRKSYADKRREALARPRVAVPDTRRSSRFHYYLRLPNWPVAPRNEGPLKPTLLVKQGARGATTLGLTLQFVFEAVVKATGWDVEDLRLTFYSRYLCDEADLRLGDDGDGQALAPAKTVVWGFDSILTGFRDLEETGLSIGDVVDIDYVPYDPRRAYFDEE